MSRPWVAGGFLAAGLSLGLAGPLGAQPAAKAADEVLLAEREWAQALVKGNREGLRRLYADDLVYVHSSGATETRDEYLRRLETGSLRYHKVELVDPQVRVYGDAAVVNGKFDVSVDVDGQRVEGRVIYVHVYVRQGGRWRMVAHQTTRPPSPAPR